MKKIILLSDAILNADKLKVVQLGDEHLLLEQGDNDIAVILDTKEQAEKAYAQVLEFLLNDQTLLDLKDIEKKGE